MAAASVDLKINTPSLKEAASPGLVDVGTIGPGGPPAFQIVIAPHTGETALLLGLALIAALCCLAFDRIGRIGRRRR